jgi:hypothetical protein
MEVECVTAHFARARHLYVESRVVRDRNRRKVMAEDPKPVPPPRTGGSAAPPKTPSDLKVPANDAGSVKGGRRRTSSDPCEGGE